MFETAVKIVQLVGPFLTITFGLIAFGLGLLAWRQQLLDKRKLEIAEQAVVMFSKVDAIIHRIRQRNPWLEMYDFIAARNPGKDDHRWYMLRREWIYRIPPDLLKVYEEAHEELESIRVLARLYLSQHIDRCLDSLHSQFRMVQAAAKMLSEIDPDPVTDPGASFDDEPHPEPASDPALRSRTPEEERDLEKRFLPYRFEQDPFDDAPADPIVIRLKQAEIELRQLCVPYVDLNPYSFLWRLLTSLRPGHRAIPK